MTEELLSIVERIAALSGTGVIVLGIVGLLRGWVYTGKSYREMRQDRDFYRALHFNQTAVLEQELGVQHEVG